MSIAILKENSFTHIQLNSIKNLQHIRDKTIILYVLRILLLTNKFHMVIIYEKRRSRNVNFNTN